MKEFKIAVIEKKNLKALNTLIAFAFACLKLWFYLYAYILATIETERIEREDIDNIF